MLQLSLESVLNTLSAIVADRFPVLVFSLSVNRQKWSTFYIHCALQQSTAKEEENNKKLYFPYIAGYLCPSINSNKRPMKSSRCTINKVHIKAYITNAS